MEALIKSFSDWHAVSHQLVVDYELKPSIYDTVSQITIQTPKESISEGDFLYLDTLDWLGVIKSIEQDEYITKLKCNQANTMFDRDILFTADFSPFDSYEGYLKDLLDENYTNISDELYQMPFLNVIAESENAGDIQPEVKDYLWKVSSYISKLRRLAGVHVSYEVERTELKVHIYKPALQTIHIDMTSSPEYKILSEDYSVKRISKIRAYWETEDNGLGYRTYYLKKNGSIVTTKPSLADRVLGEWVSKKCSNADKVLEEVQDEFAKNTYSHNITFRTTRKFELYQPLELMINDTIYTTYIASYVIKKNTDLIQYTCGELQVEYPFLELI